MNDNIDAAGRRLLHTRSVQCTGWLRPDGLWDIEGRLADVKSYPVTVAEGHTVGAGEVYHGMRVCLTLDDQLTIQAVQVEMNQAPTSECRGAMPAYDKLVGVRIGPGFTRKVKTLFGGTGGCTHLTELLLPIATTAYQTIPMGRSLVAPRNAEDAGMYDRAKARLIDTCHALRAEGPIALRYLKR